MRVLYKGLWVSELYKMASYGLRDKICNGCGPRGFWRRIPDKIFGLKITKACNPHDFDYFEGSTLYHKNRGDKWFLVNMNRMIRDAKTRRWLKRLRQQAAKTYYFFVCKYGGKYFFGRK